MKNSKIKTKTKILTTASLSDVVQINKWWEKPVEEEEQTKKDDEDEIKWKHLEHNGVLFPADYEPHKIKIKYKNEEITLTPEQEEIATFWAQLLDSDLSKKEIAIRNFTKEFRKVLPEKYKDSQLSDFDFSNIKNFLDKERENRKKKTTEEKKEQKIKRQKLMDYYGYAIVDGSVEKMDHFSVEPPGIFRGRGEQPLTGSIKHRLYAEDITLNIGLNEPVPECTQKGHSWGEIACNNEATWLAFYKVRKNTKYVFLSSSSKFKGMSDYKKYEKAKKLKNCIEKIREDYYKKLDDKSTENKQLGVATYLIDRLALRVGNEKGEDEADTVGCCTLRVEHIKFEDDNFITFDFLAKDSMRYLNTVKIEEKVYENLKKFTKGKEKTDDLFDLINAQKLNDYLKQLMDGLSAKVFRTYNASFVLQQQLNKKEFKLSDDVNAKIAYYNEANKQVAIMCNHQKTVPKNYNVKSEQMKEILNEHKKYLEELKEYLKDFGKKKAKKYQNVKTENINKVFPDSKQKTETEIKKLEEKIKKMDMKLKDREDNKQIALSTSKLNYMDPRITVSWCKKYEIPIEKVFSKSIRDKFPWAMYIDPNYNF